jgi:hypothetical protein
LFNFERWSEEVALRRNRYSILVNRYASIVDALCEIDVVIASKWPTKHIEARSNDDDDDDDSDRSDDSERREPTRSMPLRNSTPPTTPAGKPVFIATQPLTMSPITSRSVVRALALEPQVGRAFRERLPTTTASAGGGVDALLQLHTSSASGDDSSHTKMTWKEHFVSVFLFVVLWDLEKSYFSRSLHLAFDRVGESISLFNKSRENCYPPFP